MTDRRHEPFPTLARQHEADRLGMMVFLASEIMLFGALFGSAFVLFIQHHADVAVASTRLSLWLGAANTVVLLTSSLLVAIAVEAREAKARLAAIYLAGASALGLVFLGIKAIEYAKDYHDGLMPSTAAAHFADGPQELFINLYFVATSLHAIHLTIGIVVLAVLAVRLRSAKPPTASAIENAGLYWHVVDVIWVFLYPVLYLTRG